MNHQRQRSLTHAGLAASIVTAFASSICCIGPLLAAFLGFTSFAALVEYESLRPLFGSITLLFLSGSFYLAYRKPPEHQTCEPGSICATHGPAETRRVQRIVVWTVAAIVLAVWTFPTWSGWVLG